MDVFKDDIQRIYEKLDNQVKATNDLKVTVAELVIELKSVPRLRQPCKFLEAHLGDHKSRENVWYATVVRVVVSAVLGGVAMYPLLKYFLG
jgi:hypothetical protein